MTILEMAKDRVAAGELSDLDNHSLDFAREVIRLHERLAFLGADCGQPIIEGEPMKEKRFTPQRSEETHGEKPEVICLNCGTGIFVEHGVGIWQDYPGTWLSDPDGYVHDDKDICAKRRSAQTKESP